ncbi:MAG: hypothetical protein HY537_12705 [Deltaproteobacteria bacterium]|nr:hypothetical protein [Deltaproteobacteria bacterium]
MAAERRASLAGWTVSKVMPSVVPPTEEENFICYSFDIYGVECQQESLEQDGMEPTIFSSNESKQAAKPDSAS